RRCRRSLHDAALARRGRTVCTVPTSLACLVCERRARSLTVNRIDRLRDLLEEPLLVTNLVNVRYLTGFDSSNAALLVEPERARLFTDFRYVDAAKAEVPEGVDVVQTQRSVVT